MKICGQLWLGLCEAYSCRLRAFGGWGEWGEIDSACVPMEVGLPLATLIPADGKAAAILPTQLCCDLAPGTVVS